MLFYEIKGNVTDKKWADDNDDWHKMRENIRSIAKKNVKYNRKNLKNAFFFIEDIDDGSAYIGLICKQPVNLKWEITAFLKAVELELNDQSVEEVTFNTISDMLESADRNNFIANDNDVLERFDLKKLTGRYARSMDFDENMLDEAGKTAIFRKAESFFGANTFMPELNRIYEGRRYGQCVGHPVHYMIQTDDQDTRKSMCEILLQALYSNDRIWSRRYCLLDLRPGDEFSVSVLDCLYKSSIGGAIVIQFRADDDTEDDHANCGRETIENLCEVMKKYSNQVLTILCLPRECTKSKDLFYENMGSVSFVEVKEDFATGERAKGFLRMLAHENKIRADKKLFSKLEDDREYLAPDLHVIFDEWYNNKLKTDIYPQYKVITTAKQEIIKAEPKGSAYDELMEMTGLSEAKKVINQAISYYKAQKLFGEKGMKIDHTAMHMVFTGNPGTAKTTVARLFARIMKENDLLSKGDMIEVGRGDLVGKYVGWTAPIIQKKFREAQGSVLFIDEAYSLVDDRDGSYGDEAINTIVQEMENHRDDMVVIFAGYPDKMERFLKKNPGLRSRIAYHVPFADYDTDELCDIANLIAKKKGLKLTEEATGKLNVIFKVARTENDFGNGRYVRNVIEKAKMAQANRLLTMDFDHISQKDIITICAEDIEMPAISAKPVKRQIGF